MATPISNLADPSIYQTQATPQKAMSIQELVDLGRSSTALQKEKALLPYAIEKGKAESQQAVTQADTTKLENALKHTNSVIQSQQRLLTKPDLTADDIIQSAREHARTMGTPENAVNQALAGLPKDGSPTDLRAWLATNLTKTLSTQSQLEKLYPGGVLPTQLPAGGYQTTAPTTEPTTTTSGNKGVTADQMSQPPKSDFSKPVKLSYPVRQAGQAYTALPQEEEDRKVGTATKTALITRQTEIPQARRTIDEVIKKAAELEKEAILPTSGALGVAERGISTFLGTEQGIRYKELSKDLANAQIANITASGGSLATDAGKQLVRMANGDETYPPKVLIEIARRTQADMTGLDLKANAIKKFSDKFGDQNINAFNQMWAANADPRIFQLKNIFEDKNMSAKEKADARDKLIGKDEKSRKIFEEKWNNIKKLEQTGSL